MAKFSKLKVNTLSNSRDNTSDIFSTFILWNGRILQHCIGNTVFRNTALLLTSGRINGKLGLLNLMPLCWRKYSFIDSSFPSAVVILIRCIFHILYNILILKIWSWQHQINWRVTQIAYIISRAFLWVKPLNAFIIIVPD